DDAAEPFNTSNSSQQGSTALRLNASRLEVLNVTFDAQPLPSNSGNEDSYQEFFRRAQVYVLGVSHRNKNW
ncbi:hypothetical protein AAVH_42603, partial [Aphelenchoides avenae]